MIDKVATRVKTRTSRSRLEMGERESDVGSVVRSIIAGLICFFGSSILLADERYYDVDIPSTDAADALNELAEQTGAIMLFPFDLAEGRLSNEVVGHYKLEEALGVLLEGTGLSGGLSDKSVIQVSADEKSGHEDKQSTREGNAMNVTEKRGLAALLATIFVGSGTAAQEASDVREIEKGEIEEIITLGTRMKGRTAVESTGPIDVFPVAELEKTPSLDLKDAISAVSPSYYVHREAASSQDTFARETNLRGLDGGEVLILLNGKRVHRSAVVNKSSIQTPNIGTFGAASISNIEILRDGASALYGADAVAGVINFTLDSSPGFSAQTGYSERFEGDGALFTASAKFGIPVADTGFLVLTASTSEQDPTNRNVTHLGAVAMVADAARRGITLDLDPDHAQPNGITYTKSNVFTWNAAVPVNDNVELYAFGNYAEISNVQFSNYRENQYCNGGSAFHPGLRDCSEIPELHFRDGSIGAPPDVFNPTRLTQAELAELIGVERAANAAYLLADGPNATSVNGAEPVGFDPKLIYPNGFAPIQTIEGPDLGAYVGMRGELGNGLTWDLSGSYGRSAIDWYNQSLAPSRGAPMAADGSIDYANAQTDFYVGGMVNSESSISVGLGYPLDTTFVDSLLVSFGGEYRSERYYNIVGEEASWEVGPLGKLCTSHSG